MAKPKGHCIAAVVVTLPSMLGIRGGSSAISFTRMQNGNVRVGCRKDTSSEYTLIEFEMDQATWQHLKDEVARNDG